MNWKIKPTTIIFLVVGVIAIIVGTFLCLSADSSAKADGYDLHESLFDENGNITNTYSFALEDQVTVHKIDLVIENAEVLVIGGAAKSEIVIENMFAGTYACYVSNKVISFTNKLELSTLIDAAKDINFTGIRQYLDLQIFKKRTPTIKVYINENAEDIKQLSLTLNGCNVNVNDVNGALDFRIKATDSFINFEDCTTNSSVYTELTNSDANYTNFGFDNFELKSKDSTFKFDSSLVVIYRFNVTSDINPITVNGIEYENEYKLNEAYEDYPTVNIYSENSFIELDFLN